jgi:cytokinesis protein
LSYEELFTQKCKAENQAIADERAAAEKRLQYAEEMKVARAEAKSKAPPPDENATALDDLLEKLRNGDTVGNRKHRRARPSTSQQPVSPIKSTPGGMTSTADIARDMLAALQQDGFATFDPSSLKPSTPKPERSSARRARLRPNALSLSDVSAPLIEEAATTPTTASHARGDLTPGASSTASDSRLDDTATEEKEPNSS